MRFAGQMSVSGHSKLPLYGGLLVALLSALFVRLGVWQLDRARQKHEAYAQYTANAAAAVVDLADLLNEPAEGLLWRKVRVTGSYVAGADVLLDNQSHAGQPGYLVYTPMRLRAPSRIAVLVNRGWIPLGGKREAVEVPAVDSSQRTILAQVGKPPPPGLRLSGDDTVEVLPGGIRRVQRLDYTVLGAALGVSLQPYVLLLDAGAEDGFTRAWQPPGSDEDRHRSYAVQWFAMAAALVAIYLILLLQVRR
jgi:surfeit locus 1 family protein